MSIRVAHVLAPFPCPPSGDTRWDNMCAITKLAPPSGSEWRDLGFHRQIDGGTKFRQILTNSQFLRDLPGISTSTQIHGFSQLGHCSQPYQVPWLLGRAASEN